MLLSTVVRTGRMKISKQSCSFSFTKQLLVQCTTGSLSVFLNHQIPDFPVAKPNHVCPSSELSFRETKSKDLSELDCERTLLSLTFTQYSVHRNLISDKWNFIIIIAFHDFKCKYVVTIQFFYASRLSVSSVLTQKKKKDSFLKGCYQTAHLRKKKRHFHFHQVSVKHF